MPAGGSGALAGSGVGGALTGGGVSTGCRAEPLSTASGWQLASSPAKETGAAGAAGAVVAVVAAVAAARFSASSSARERTRTPSAMLVTADRRPTERAIGVFYLPSTPSAEAIPRSSTTTP